jgi:hypothetical protein
MGPVLCNKLLPRGFADLTDVTLVDEDTNSIPTNDTNRTIQDNVAMPVTNPGGQFENICKWSDGQYRNQCKLPGLLQFYDTVKTNLVLCGAIWWANLQLMQLAASGGQIWNQCKWRHLVDSFVTNSSGAIRWPTLQLAQVVSSGGQICKRQHFMTKFETVM